MARSSMVRGIVVDVVDVDELVEVVDVDVVDVVEVLDDVEDVLDELDELVVDDVAGTVVLVVDSMVSMTDITESGSTTKTCVSAFRRRTSLLSSSATKPFTLLANTLLTSLPSDSSLRTFAATLTVSFRMTM